MTVFLAIWASCGYSQKTDYIWLTGYSSLFGYDSLYECYFGISTINFNSNTPGLTYDSLGISFSAVDVAISDDTGRLLFYTNGITVCNNKNAIIRNGDSLNNGWFLNNNSYWYELGRPLENELFILSNPYIKNTYDIFYSYIDIDSHFFPFGRGIKRAQVKVNDDPDSDFVNYKDRSVAYDSINSAIAATKHANGRDWWICSMIEETNCYMLSLYDGSDSLKFSELQCNGFIYHREENPVMKFSPDGGCLISGDNEQGLIDVFQFDRCSGRLTFQREIFIPELVDSQGSYLMTSAEFSASGRYLYVCCNRRLLQFDLENPVDSLSKQIVATYNPYERPAPFAYSHIQRGPDGKIYIGSDNTTYYLAVINSPDSAGMKCNVQDTGLKLPSFNWGGVPYYPNYRLGSLKNSPCDSIQSDSVNGTSVDLKIFPNPASNMLQIDYSQIDWNKGPVYLDILDVLGRKIYNEELPRYSSFANLDITRWVNGAYIISLRHESYILKSRIFIKI